MIPGTPSKAFIHDLRNLLAPIRNAAHLLRLRSGDDAGLLPIAEQIERQIKSIGTMLDAAGDQVDSAVPPSRKSDATVRPRRLLVADDSEPVRQSISQVLTELGHEVKTARDGDEAMAIAIEWMPDWVLLDAHMPKMSGIEAARRLRSKFPSGAMKLILMSGDNLDEHTIHAAKQAGFDHCVDKVGDLDVLNQVLQT